LRAVPIVLLLVKRFSQFTAVHVDSDSLHIDIICSLPGTAFIPRINSRGRAYPVFAENKWWIQVFLPRIVLRRSSAEPFLKTITLKLPSDLATEVSADHELLKIILFVKPCPQWRSSRSRLFP
jgi:hypothetical protein